MKYAAIAALSRIGAKRPCDISLLVEQFINESSVDLTGAGRGARVTSARDALVRTGEPAVPALLKILNSTNRATQVRAIEALGLIGPKARAAVPWLIHEIERPAPVDDTRSLAYCSVQALGQIGLDASAAVPALNRLLENDAVQHGVIITALARIGSPPIGKLVERSASRRRSRRSPLPDLARTERTRGSARAKKALTDREPQVRFNSATALAFIEPSATESIPVLIDALSRYTGNDFDVSDAPRALARIGPKAAASLPKLIELLKEAPADQALFEAVVEIDPDGKHSVPVLIDLLDGDDADVVAVAADCLGLLGPRAKLGVPALARTVARDFEQHDKLAAHDPVASAVVALRRIGPSAKAAIPILIRLLSTHRADGSVEDATAETLGWFGADARAAVPALIETIRNGSQDEANWTICRPAILTLGQIGPEARAAVPLLRSFLTDEDGPSVFVSDVLTALCRLDPEGTALAETWLSTQSTLEPGSPWMYLQIQRRAAVIGALGRASFETDWLTRHYLDRLDSDLVTADSADDDASEATEEIFRLLGRFGPAARVAIPRITELRTHPSPFVRLWAAEALEKIMAPALAAAAATSLRLDQAR